MAVRAVTVLTAAIVVTIVECQQQNITFINFSIGTGRGQSWQNEFSPSTAWTRPLIDEDGLFEDGLCRLTTIDPYVHTIVAQMLAEDEVTLIEYQLSFPNYSRNPLRINMAGAYDAKKWARVTTAHGQTLLSLAFNYGVLSMKTLTLGTKTLNVELQDLPPGCMAAVSDQRKIDSVRRLLMRDFDADGSITTVDDGRVCNEIIVDDGGYAKFRHNCCYKNSVTVGIECTTDIGNMWLDLLYALLTIVRVGLVFLGPSLFISAVLSMSKDSVPYVVPLESKLEKTVCFYRADKIDLPPVSAKRVLNLSLEKGFSKLQKCLKESNVQLGQPIKVRFPQYDINVDYRRVQKENMVPVGLFYSLFSAIFRCQIRFLMPFRKCCKAKMFPHSNQCTITWGRFCKRLAKILLILILLTPFYLRLIVFYVFEYDEVEKRKKAIAVGGLKESLDSSLIYYFTPTHGVFICMYVLYVITAIALAFMSQKGKDHRVKKVIVNSFRELKSLNFTDTLSMMASNMVWPLENFGVLGCCVGYLPLAIIGSLVVGTVYLLPTLYLTYRMAYHSKLAAVVMSLFQARKLLEKWNKADDVASNKSNESEPIKLSWRRVAKYVFCAFVSILTLYSVVIMLSEVIGCLVEIMVFTIMGCIVNANALLQYVMLILMIIAYCGECFNNMHEKYLKMNRALFSEVNFRMIKKVQRVTSLPSSLQENCAFKSQELNEQAAYEASDDVAEKPANHWRINDLVLFVDNEDTPRIPIKLFNDVIHIRVAGVPGPIYRGHIEAFQQLSKIVLFVVFVFLVVLSFGNVYKISATNQSLATLVGGFLPRMLTMFLAPPRPEVELGTVSFKSKMDQVIKNFRQYWPIYDLPFEVVKDEGEDPNAEAKTDPNKNRSELLTTEESKRDNEQNNHIMYSIGKNCRAPIDDNFGEFDGSIGQQLLADQLSVRNKPVKKSEEVVVTIEDQIDIAIYLPQWRDN